MAFNNVCVFQSQLNPHRCFITSAHIELIVFRTVDCWSLRCQIEIRNELETLAHFSPVTSRPMIRNSWEGRCGNFIGYRESIVSQKTQRRREEDSPVHQHCGDVRHDWWRRVCDWQWQDEGEQVCLWYGCSRMRNQIGFWKFEILLYPIHSSTHPIQPVSNPSAYPCISIHLSSDMADYRHTFFCCVQNSHRVSRSLQNRHFWWV